MTIDGESSNFSIKKKKKEKTEKKQRNTIFLKGMMRDGDCCRQIATKTKRKEIDVKKVTIFL